MNQLQSFQAMHSCQTDKNKTMIADMQENKKIIIKIQFL
jgi:hypothetical protein